MSASVDQRSRPMLSQTRPWVRWLVDASVAGLAVVTALPYMWDDRTEHDWRAVVAIATVTSGPVLMRRVWPRAVFAWVLVGGVAAALWEPRFLPALGLLAVLYTVASLRAAIEALVCAGLVEIVAVVAVLRASPQRWLDAVFTTGMVTAALGFGLYSATRRSHLAALHDRAVRLAHERDQQGALAAAAERERIARDMHDIVAHHLAAIVALSQGAVAVSKSSPDRAVDTMRAVSDTARRALTDTRRLLNVLRQPDRDTTDTLRPTPDLTQLDEVVSQIRRAGIPIALRISGSLSDLPADVQLAAYRIIQEALTNTLKHAGPDAHATVELQHHHDELAICITDTGTTSHNTAVTAGNGLTGMRERAHALDGNVHYGPRHPNGWHVTAHLPIPQTNGEQR